jgi:hypothetical protein
VSSRLRLVLMCAIIGASIFLPVTAVAKASANSPRLANIKLDPSSWKPMFGVVPYVEGSRSVEAQAKSRRTIPFWKGSDGSYAYTMVGTDPFTQEGPAALTTIKTEVFPVVVTFSDSGEVFNPLSPDPSCSPNGSAASLTMASPVFQPTTLTPGGTSLGTGEYPTYLFQRANFYAQTAGPEATNPNYGINLRAVEEPPIHVVVPPLVGESVTMGCNQLGLIDAGFWDTDLGGVITALKPLIRPTVLPIFLFYNVVLFAGTPNQCCIVGYHGGFHNPAYQGAPQTYVVADFDTSGLFSGSSDITALSHEVGEWMDDPKGDNVTPVWGNAGEVSGCTSNVLEVGDPLSGTAFPVTMPNGYTYHPQDLAFKSWFYGDDPSSGVNGWYSFNGTFKTPAAVCP